MKRDIIFIVCVSILILTLIIGIDVRGINEISIIENRPLVDFPRFSMDSFFDTGYQSNIEDALTDQILFGEYFKATFNSIKNNNLSIMVYVLKGLDRSKTNKFGSNNIDKIELDIEDLEKLLREELLISEGKIPGNFTFETNLTPKGNSFFQIEDSGHIIAPKRTVLDANKLFELKANNYNMLVENYPELSYYIYYIETSSDIDFINGEMNHDLVKSFFEKLNSSIKKDAFYINSLEVFKKYFYKTDHHWNTEGQLKGYTDIIRLLKGEDEEKLDIKTELIEGIEYYGYRARSISDFSVSDEFSILVADLPEHRVFINGKEKPYDNKKEYIAGEHSWDKGFNHYGIANGGDYALVEYRFNQPEKENILVFVESFSNPINSFIASYYNNTYFIDLRFYEKTYGKKFDFGDFVNENNIEQVLFTGYYFFYANNEFLITD